VTVGDVRLESPRVIITREGHEDLEVQTDNRDMIVWETTRARHKWPKFDEAPMMWLTFLAWSAARRTGAIDNGYTWERWREETLQAKTVKDEPNSELGTPFGEEAEPDSS
jgi:hypothetical protein